MVCRNIRPPKSLKTLQPPSRPREAWIALDSEPCDDCIVFKGTVQDTFDVTFHFVEMGKIVAGKVVQGYGDPKTPSRKSLRNIQVATPPETVRPTTQSRKGKQRTQLITPPKLAAPPPEKNSHKPREFDDPDHSEDSDPISPCHKRNRRPSGRRPNLEIPNDNLCLFEVKPALRNGKLRKRPSNELAEEMEDGPGYTQPLSSLAERLSTAKRSMRSMAPAPSARRLKLTPSYLGMQNSNSQSQLEEHRYNDGGVQWSARIIIPAINGDLGSRNAREQEGDSEEEQIRGADEGDHHSQELLSPSTSNEREALETGPPQVLIPMIDLTLDVTTDDDGDHTRILFLSIGKAMVFSHVVSLSMDYVFMHLFPMFTIEISPDMSFRLL